MLTNIKRKSLTTFSVGLAIKKQKGQALVESAVSLLLLSSFGIFALAIILHFFGHLVLTRWAAYNSRCVAMISDVHICANKTKFELKKYFGMREVKVSTSVWQGVIHSQIEAPFIGVKKIVAKFDLEPSEFKRVKK